MVSISGVDTFDRQPERDRYIQPLDRGDFDLAGFLKTLQELGYTGPIGHPRIAPDGQAEYEAKVREQPVP